MNIKTFEVNPLGENCYVVSDDTREAVIIDCGCSTESEWADIKECIATQDLQVQRLLTSHLPFDHVWGNAFVYRDFGVKPEANFEDL
ncbi:MAG: MBL fold metallo-hydrolase, partial [Bacteroidaceae bacterium]|nr:MBL fold metallo-hydrolase [Bacteroidaceae bacterium]